MTLFEQLKSFPKVDLHINLTSSISTDLAFDLSDEENFVDVLDQMREKNVFEYEQALKIPLEILKNSKNVVLAIDDLISRLKKNNVIYGELFFDLPLYIGRLDQEKCLKVILDEIQKQEYPLQVVLVISSEKSREYNLKTLELLDKYYGKGVNGVYFQKSKMTNIRDYMYVFDRLIRYDYSYIINMNSKISNQEYDIYMHARRIIYSLSTYDEELIRECRESNIILEFSVTRLKESNLIDMDNWFIFELIKENSPLITFTSCDMTTLNTDVLNEWCLLFNNYTLNIHDLVKVINSNLSYINVPPEEKEKIIQEFRDKGNLVL